MTSRRASNSGSDSGSEDEGDMGLGNLMPRSPTPEPIPFSYATYDVPDFLPYTLPGGGRELSIRLVGTHPLWGHHLWNTARVTTTYLLQHAPTLVTGKRVLELGAGGALPSLACAMAGAETVCATDYADDSLMENIAFNAQANLGADEAVASHIHAVGHTWGKNVQDVLECSPPAGEDGRYDVVILSDLMFNHSQHDALIKTLDATLKLTSAPPASESDPVPTPCALVFFTHHRPRFAEADMAFMPRLAESGNWAYERVVEEWTGPMFAEDPGDERVRGTVHGFRCWRITPSDAT